MNNKINKGAAFFYIQIQKGFFNNDNNIELTSELGGEGYGIYMYTIEALIGTDGVDKNKLYKKIKRDLGASAEALDKVIDVSDDLYIYDSLVKSQFIEDEAIRIGHNTAYGKRGGQAKQFNMLKKQGEIDKCKEYALECFPTDDKNMELNITLAAEAATDYKHLNQLLKK